MAVSAIARQSEDKIMRQAYQRRQDEIYFHNLELANHLQAAEEYRQRAEQNKQRAEKAEAEIETLRKRLAEFEAQTKDKK